MNADTRERITNNNNAFRAMPGWLLTGFDKDAARAVYTKARNKSNTWLRKSKNVI